MRVVLRTRATALELDTVRTRVAHRGAPPRPEGVDDLVVDGRLAGQASTTGGDTLPVDLGDGSVTQQPGPVGTVRFAGLAAGRKTVEVWLPWNETTELVALRTDAPVEPVTDDARRTRVHHGSSISHGSNAASPTTTWPALAAAAGGVQLVLGLGGSALDASDGTVRFRATGDPAEVARGALTLRVVRDELARVVAQRAPDDPHLHLLDGLRLYGEADAAGLPLPAGLHPDAATHRRIGERFAAAAFGPGGAFASGGRARA